MVLASNVLHATKDVHQTLAHLAWLLAPSGVLAMYKATHHPAWFDVTTGLIAGWQRFADDLRTDVPLIGPEVWSSALTAAGFSEVRAFPDSGNVTAVLGQHVIVSRGSDDGVTTRPLTASGDGVPAEALAGVTAAERHDPLALREEIMALPELNRRERLVAYVRECVMRVLRLDPTLPPEQSHRLIDLGVDSLMAVELRNDVSNGLALERRLPATLIFDRRPSMRSRTTCWRH